MDSKEWTPCIPSEVIDNWGIKCAGQSAHLMLQARRVGHHCPGRRFASSNETTVSGLSTRHPAFNLREPLFCLAKKCRSQVSDISSCALSALSGHFVLREPRLFVLNSSASIKTQTPSLFLHTLKILEFTLLKSSLCPP
ncbi:hypothetical protein Pyn_04782 [Prunus yedoensis var. nudiflora]|uniref:Uncharacterized protein n=1 Tax=Prunus yedoensis var. nudiflora TaxID=2094558 RepID=A0A314Y792_PRUYE|nr:hypothetical protein Pyn_04782 [Prunus yedoensis var. nudiflora]